MADHEKRAVKRKRYTSNMITIKVGAKAEAITVHEDCLREHSPFFKAALDKKWKEGKTHEIELKEDEFEVVATYIDWLYSGSIEEVTKTTERTDWDNYAKLYVFGEKVQDDVFCDAALSVIVQHMDMKDTGSDDSYDGDDSEENDDSEESDDGEENDNSDVSANNEDGSDEPTYWTPGGKAVSIIYEGTPEGSPIRHLLVDSYAERAQSGWLDGHDKEHFPREFLADLTRALLDGRTAKQTRKYHEEQSEWKKQK